MDTGEWGKGVRNKRHRVIFMSWKLLGPVIPVYEWPKNALLKRIDVFKQEEKIVCCKWNTRILDFPNSKQVSLYFIVNNKEDPRSIQHPLWVRPSLHRVDGPFCWHQVKGALAKYPSRTSGQVSRGGAQYQLGIPHLVSFSGWGEVISLIMESRDMSLTNT
jgi:hypothetical protein